MGTCRRKCDSSCKVGQCSISNDPSKCINCINNSDYELVGGGTPGVGSCRRKCDSSCAVGQCSGSNNPQKCTSCINNSDYELVVGGTPGEGTCRRICDPSCAVGQCSVSKNSQKCTACVSDSDYELIVGGTPGVGTCRRICDSSCAVGQCSESNDPTKCMACSDPQKYELDNSGGPGSCQLRPNPLVCHSSCATGQCSVEQDQTKCLACADSEKYELDKIGGPGSCVLKVVQKICHPSCASSHCTLDNDSTKCTKCRNQVEFELDTKEGPGSCVKKCDPKDVNGKCYIAPQGAVYIGFILIEEYSARDPSDLSFKIQLKESEFSFQELKNIKKTFTENKDFFELSGKLKTANIEVDFDQRIEEDKSPSKSLYLRVNMTSRSGSFQKPTENDIIQLNVKNKLTVMSMDAEPDFRSVLLKESQQTVEGNYYVPQPPLSENVKQLSQGAGAVNSGSTSAATGFSVIFSLLAMDPNGLLLNLNNFLSLIKRFRFFGVNFGSNLEEFLDLMSGGNEEEGGQQAEGSAENSQNSTKTLRRVLAKLRLGSGVQRLYPGENFDSKEIYSEKSQPRRKLSITNQESDKRGSRYKFDKYGVSVTLERTQLIKSTVYIISWYFKLIGIWIFHKMKKRRQISKLKVYYIFYQRRIHFVLFNISVMDLMFFCTRIILHRINDLNRVVLKAYCFFLMILLQIDLISIFVVAEGIGMKKHFLKR